MSDQDRTKQLTQRVCRALEANRPHDAVRLVVTGAEKRILPSGAELLKLLQRLAGARRAKLLIKAFAYYPCMGCKDGLESCERCKDRARAAWRKMACEHCLDFGMTRCDFCDGAGWVTYNFIPAGLRASVIAERMNTALKAMEAQLKKKTPRVTAANAKKLGSLLEQRILALNRLAGILENALTASKSRTAGGPQAGTFAKKVIRVASQTWPRLEKRMREQLLKLAEVLRLEATRASTGGAREIMQDRAKFYELLSRSRGFAGTSLEHPFLARSA